MHRHLNAHHSTLGNPQLHSPVWGSSASELSRFVTVIIPVTIHSPETAPDPTEMVLRSSPKSLSSLASPGLVQPASHIPSSSGTSELPPLPPSSRGTPHSTPSLCPRVVLDLTRTFLSGSCAVSIHSEHLKERERSNWPYARSSLTVDWAGASQMEQKALAVPCENINLPTTQ